MDRLDRFRFGVMIVVGGALIAVSGLGTALLVIIATL